LKVEGTTSFGQGLRWHNGDMRIFLFILCARHIKSCAGVTKSCARHN